MKLIAFIALAVFTGACTTIPTRPARPTSTAIPVPTLATGTTLVPFGPTLAAAPTSAAQTREPQLAPTSLPTGGIGLCENAFYPVRPDRSMPYQVLSGTSVSSTYSKTVIQVTANSFTERRDFGSKSADQHWSCTDRGLASKEFSTLLAHGLVQFDLDTTSSTGVTLLRSNEWKLGATWSNSYEIKGQVTQNGTTTNGTGTVDINHAITAQEAANVPAGRYEAWRVDSVLTLHLNASRGAFNIPVRTIELSESTWYARDIGMVKSALTMEGQTATTELLAAP